MIPLRPCSITSGTAPWRLQLEGRELDDATIARAADAAAAEVDPMDDLQGSAEYRRDMLRVWVRRVVTGLAEGGAS